MEYYPRKIEKNLKPWIKRKEIVIIRGARQTGKTTLLKHLQEEYGGKYFTLEDQEIKEAIEKDPKLFLESIKKEKIVYLDEMQYLKNAGKILKFLFDLTEGKPKFVITGSGSFEIKVEIGRYLVGRCVYFELFPLDFEEFLEWKNKELKEVYQKYKKEILDWLFDKRKRIKKEIIFEKEFLRHLKEYLIFGGFPAIVKEKEKENKIVLLRNLLRTYVEKDIFFFLGIRHFEKFLNVLKYLAFNITSLLEISNISQELKIDYKTLRHYLNILEETYLIKLIPPFYKNLSTELKKVKKIYFLDLGLRNALLNNFLEIEKREDAGKILENYIFIEMKDIFEQIKYWRTTGKAEIDLIGIKNQKIYPIEIKSHQRKIERSFMSFLEKYNVKRGIVFSLGKVEERKIGKSKVLFVPHFLV